MKFRSQTPRFRRRMAPLALFSGLLVGVLLPGVNGKRVEAERVGEAVVWAQQLGARLGEQDPSLALFSTELQSGLGISCLTDLASLRVVLADTLERLNRVWGRVTSVRTVKASRCWEGDQGLVGGR